MTLLRNNWTRRLSGDLLAEVSLVEVYVVKTGTNEHEVRA